jgi:DDE_Tnp_1-associated
MTLLEAFSELPDVRRGQGRRHEISHVLVCLLLSTLSGGTSWRDHADFIQRHREELLARLRPSKARLPSYSTLRRVLIGLDFDALSAAFLRWARPQICAQAGEWWAIDGKSLRGTATHAHDPQQNFTALVSLYAHQRGLVLHSQAYTNKHDSEVHIVEALLAEAPLSGAGVSADALHCKKSSAPSSMPATPTT